MKSLCLLLVLVGVCVANEPGYRGWRHLQVYAHKQWQYDLLSRWENNGKAVLFSERRPEAGMMEMILSDDGFEAAHRALKAAGMKPEILMEDYQSFLDEEFERLAKKPRAYDPNNWNTFDDIYTEIDRLASESCPSGFSCSTRSIGTTYENREIRIISITKGSGRQSIWLDSLIHAREWLAGTTAMRILDALMTGYGTDAGATRVLDTYDFHYVPVLNPDGYVYTWSSSTTRLWRKNRSVISGSTCRGVDLNRNHDGPWNAGGSSTNPCSDTYHGPSANSEQESSAYQAEVTRLGNVYLLDSLHAAAYMYLIPFGTSQIYPNCRGYPDYSDLYANAGAAVAAIHALYPSPTWRYGDVCSTIYVASGSSMDWAKLRAGVKYVVTPEMRGNNFTPPTSSIFPSFNENYAALVAMVDYTRTH